MFDDIRPEEDLVEILERAAGGSIKDADWLAEGDLFNLDKVEEETLRQISQRKLVRK